MSIPNVMVDSKVVNFLIKCPFIGTCIDIILFISIGHFPINPKHITRILCTFIMRINNSYY